RSSSLTTTTSWERRAPTSSTSSSPRSARSTSARPASRPDPDGGLYPPPLAGGGGAKRRRGSVRFTPPLPGMTRFLLRRLLLALVTLWLLSVIVFLAGHVLPGDVGRRIMGPFADSRAVASLDHQLGVDRPLL